MGCGQNSFKLVWRWHQLLSGFLAKGDLPRVLCLLANDRVMRWYWGCAQISWHLPSSWGKPRKTSAKKPSLKAVRPVFVSNWTRYLQMTSIGLHNMSGRNTDPVFKLYVTDVTALHAKDCRAEPQSLVFALNMQFTKIRGTCFWNVCHAPQNNTSHPDILPTKHLFFTVEV